MLSSQLTMEPRSIRSEQQPKQLKELTVQYHPYAADVVVAPLMAFAGETSSSSAEGEAAAS